jgi:hypothetical protein
MMLVVSTEGSPVSPETYIICPNVLMRALLKDMDNGFGWSQTQLGGMVGDSMAKQFTF